MVGDVFLSVVYWIVFWLAWAFGFALASYEAPHPTV